MRLRCVLEVSWGHLGVSGVALGGFLAGLGSFLGDFWEHFLKIFCHLEQYAKIAKNIENLRFFIDFRGFGRVPGFEKSKSSMKIGSKRPRESKNEAKGGQERLRDAKMEAKRRPKRG